MSEPDPTALDTYYKAAKEAARELVTLVMVAEQHDADSNDPGGHLIRGQVRQVVNAQTMLQNTLLVEVLVRSVAATYDDLEDWASSVLMAIAQEDER